MTMLTINVELHITQPASRLNQHPFTILWFGWETLAPIFNREYIKEGKPEWIAIAPNRIFPTTFPTTFPNDSLYIPCIFPRNSLSILSIPYLLLWLRVPSQGLLLLGETCLARAKGQMIRPVKGCHSGWVMEPTELGEQPGTLFVIEEIYN